MFLYKVGKNLLFFLDRTNNDIERQNSLLEYKVQSYLCIHIVKNVHLTYVVGAMKVCLQFRYKGCKERG